ncbi:hypothetical protein OAF63_01995 [Saprospiraceae bacterium]|jgi:hypothetical protein|nr:hypothetical protein [Bacteroidota bacterium]MDB4727536.1 hypothetical protein [Saprospiraceae bacterium]MDF1866246.1 hypothetical protein [Saprospiraceae bacterium]
MTRLKARYRFWRMKWAKFQMPALLNNKENDEITDFDHRPYVSGRMTVFTKKKAYANHKIASFK